MKRIVDLSHPLYHGMPVWPDSPAMGVMEQATYEESGWNESLLTFDIHTGTHMDAPFHATKAGIRVDKIPLEVFVGEACVIDLTRKRAKEAITPKDLEKYDKVVRQTKRVILNTGWYKRFGKKGKPDYYRDFPEMTMESAAWMAERGVLLLGLDLPSPSMTWNYPMHQFLFDKGMLVIIENMTNLGRIRRDVFQLVALPLRFRGREGSPLRAIAIED